MQQFNFRIILVKVAISGVDHKILSSPALAHPNIGAHFCSYVVIVGLHCVNLIGKLIVKGAILKIQAHLSRKDIAHLIIS